MLKSKGFIAASAFFMILFAAEQSLANSFVSCADPKKRPAYNTSDSSANNVPIKQCYLKPTTKKCVFHNGPHSAGGVDEPCPDFVAGKNCCGWEGMIATGPVGGGTGGGTGGGGGSGGGGSGGVGTGAGGTGMDPCAGRGLFLINGDPLNLNPQKGVLCCSSRTPKVDMLSGKKVCCEVIKP